MARFRSVPPPFLALQWSLSRDIVDRDDAGFTAALCEFLSDFDCSHSAAEFFASDGLRSFVITEVASGDPPGTD